MIIREEARKRDKEEARRIMARQEAHRRVDLESKRARGERFKREEAKHRIREMAAETEALRRRMEEISYRYV